MPPFYFQRPWIRKEQGRLTWMKWQSHVFGIVESC